MYLYITTVHSTSYFYSKDLNSPIKSLVIENLEKDFQNADFINEVTKLKSLTAKIGDTFEINNLHKKYYR